MQDTNVKLAMFIAMDDPEHGAQRKTVAPAFGPSEIAEHAVALRERTARLLDSLPVGETFDWVERVSIELTTSMIARSEEHTSELQSLMRTSYAVFCLKKKNKK